MKDKNEDDVVVATQRYTTKVMGETAQKTGGRLWEKNWSKYN